MSLESPEETEIDLKTKDKQMGVNQTSELQKSVQYNSRPTVQRRQSSRVWEQHHKQTEKR